MRFWSAERIKEGPEKAGPRYLERGSDKSRCPPCVTRSHVGVPRKRAEAAELGPTRGHVLGDRVKRMAPVSIVNAFGESLFGL